MTTTLLIALGFAAVGGLQDVGGGAGGQVAQSRKPVALLQGEGQAVGRHAGADSRGAQGAQHPGAGPHRRRSGAARRLQAAGAPGAGLGGQGH